MRSEFQDSMLQLQEMGYQIAATPGTADYYKSRGLHSLVTLTKPTDNETDQADTNSLSLLSWIKERKIDLVINIPEGTTRRDEVTSGYLMRRAAVDFGISLLTNIK